MFFKTSKIKKKLVKTMLIQSECYRFISKVKDIHDTFCPKTCKINCLDCKYTKNSSQISVGLKTVFVKANRV